jgi:hypothetical protein
MNRPRLKTIGKIALILMLGMVVGLMVCLPFLHGLHHDGLTESADCPVVVLQQGLALAFLCLALLGASVVRPPRLLRLLPLRSVPLPFRVRGFSFSNRAPPHHT